MADNSDQDKTEEPTSKKINDAHKKGQFAKSQEITTVAILGACFTAIVFAGPDRIGVINSFAATTFSHLHDTDLGTESAVQLFRSWIMLLSRVLMPILGGVMIAAFLAGGLQSGFKLTPKAMEADLNKLNPVKGFGKVFNKQSFVQLLVDLVKFVAMFGILYRLIRNIMNDPIFSAPVPLDYIGEFLYHLFLEMLSKLLEMMIVIAVIDYAWQKHKTHEDLKMSKQEVKDEHRMSEGDPHVKGRQRQFAMQLMRNSARKAVPGADVVVTNPTHYAVALKYEQGIDKAPVVIAKGTGRMAMLIKEIAREHSVPMVENKPVARLLYKTTPIDGTIPLELFQVVAQILAHVYRTHRYYFYRLRARRIAMRSEPARSPTV